jgi:hypothetical protein
LPDISADFFESPIEDDAVFANIAGAGADAFFCFGFRISRLLRFCPLATVSSDRIQSGCAAGKQK